MVRLADGRWLTMTDARAQSPAWDMTRAWNLPLLPDFELPSAEDEPLDRYLTRIGFTPEMLNYAQRSWVNAACSSLDQFSAKVLLEDWGLIRASGDSFYGDPLSDLGEGDFRILDGYDHLHHYLAEGLDIRLNTVITNVYWDSEGVRLVAQDGSIYEGERLIVTLPLAVLKAGRVRFTPALPDWKQDAIDALAMRPAMKLIYRFSQPLTQGIWAVYSAGVPSMWWTPNPDAEQDQVWMAFATADRAEAIRQLPEDERLPYALSVLLGELNQQNVVPDAMHLVDWTDDPFTLGGYSSTPPGAATMRHVLALPIENRLFFAGEATAPNPFAATVHGAYMTGRRAAHEIAAMPAVQPSA